MNIIIGRKPAVSTGITGRLRLEPPKYVSGDLKSFDVLTEVFWLYDLNNLVLVDGAVRSTEPDVTGTFKVQTFRVLGSKAGQPVVEVTSWGLFTGTTKSAFEINRNFGMASALSANSPGGFLIRGDTYLTHTTLTLVAANMTAIPGPSAPSERFGITIGDVAVNGSNAAAGWVLARGNGEKFKGGLQRSERIYLMYGGPTSGSWY